MALGNKIYIEFNYIKMYRRYEIVPICPYHFVPIPFCPYTILSATILSGHHVDYSRRNVFAVITVILFGYVTEQRKDEDYDEVVEENLENEVKRNHFVIFKSQ